MSVTELSVPKDYITMQLHYIALSGKGFLLKVKFWIHRHFGYSSFYLLFLWKGISLEQLSL